MSEPKWWLRGGDQVSSVARSKRIDKGDHRRPPRSTNIIANTGTRQDRFWYNSRDTKLRRGSLMSWHVLSAESGCEDDIVEALTERGITGYCPHEVRWRRVRRRRRNGGPGRERITLALFPGYLFVKADLNETPAMTICSLSGVYGFLCVEGRPLPVREDQIERVRVAEGTGIYNRTALQPLSTMYAANIGDTVTIADGAMTGLMAEILNLNRRAATLTVGGFAGRITIPLAHWLETVDVPRGMQARLA